MAVAPWGRPVATREYAAMITGDHCSAGRWRNTAAGMGDLLLELAQSSDPGYGGVARKPPNRFSGERSAPFDLTCRSAVDTSQRIAAGLDDQLRAWTGTVRMPRADSRLAALDQAIGEPLFRSSRVALGRLGKRLERGTDDRPARGVGQPSIRTRPSNGCRMRRYRRPW